MPVSQAPAPTDHKLGEPPTPLQCPGRGLAQTEAGVWDAPSPARRAVCDCCDLALIPQRGLGALKGHHPCYRARFPLLCTSFLSILASGIAQSGPSLGSLFPPPPQVVHCTP